ncbi:ATPase [Altererythrobacter sp. TH136]|uniref:ATPase n=1 Tax=Altererythrobacter sp. TH136 TaxID=2067415 RepID=UPI001164382F|nr:ATPase [Altererythrobacter sp. TH136]QDM39975.1 ATPase [Altererythrobacter sp. TH136]
MSGGSHIRAIGAGSGADASGETTRQDSEPLTLDETWAEVPEHEADWDEPSPASRSGLVVPAMAGAAIVAWTAFFAWAHLSELRTGVTPQGGSQLLIDWSIPTLLVIGVWLLAMRNSRRETRRFGDTAVTLRTESAALEVRLSVVNRELSLAREFLAAQTRELDSLGRVATQRLSEHADRLQDLVRDNGTQVEAIAGVSRTALDNMDKLRGDLPVIANAARDVTSQIGNAGNTAHSQLAELIAGFGRLNEFGQASERQVGTLRAKVDAAIAGFEAQASQLDEIAGARFTLLLEKSDAFRAELDGREVDTLAAMRHRADRLREEVAAAANLLETQEEELLKSMQARLAALRDGAITVGDGLAGTERQALAAWNTRLDALKADLAAAIKEVEAIDIAARDGASERLRLIQDEAVLVDDQLKNSHALFVDEVDKRRSEAAALAAEQAELIQERLALIDQALSERRAGHAVQAEELAQQSEILGMRLDALGAEMARAADQGREAETALASSIDVLAARLTESREALTGTDRAVASLTEASVRLLELIRASADHTRTDLPAALGNAEERLEELSQRGERLGLMLGQAGEQSRELSEYVILASRDSAAAMGDLKGFHGQFTATFAANEQDIANLRAQLAALAEDSRGTAAEIQGPLREAIGALESSARDAIASLERDSAGQVAALAERIGADAAGAIDRALQTHVGAALAELDESAAQAAGAGRAAALQLRDQLARVNELTANLENRVAHARQRAEEQVDSDFARRVALITESLNSNAIDLAKALSSEVTDTAWASYLRGDRGIFTRRAVRLIDNTQAREISDLFESDREFREHVSRYIHDFEAMLRAMLSTRDGNAIGVTLLSSDMGKLYVALAQAIERLRD